MSNTKQQSPDMPPEALHLLHQSGLKALQIAGRTLLPVVQGGMGIGISGNRLAGSVAAAGGVGTLSSVDLRRHHPDLMDRTRELAPGEEAKAGINAANYSEKVLMWQTIIHVVFLLSALAIALTDRLMAHSTPPARH